MFLNFVNFIKNNLFKSFFVFIFIAEFLSFVSFLNSDLSPFIFIAVTIILIFLIVKKIEFGVALVFIELIVGSLGKMFFLEVYGFDISIRMVIWVAVMFSFIARIVFSREKLFFIKSSLFKPYLFLAIVVIWGIIWGIIKGNNLGIIFSDANSYLFFLLIFPVYETFYKQEENFKRFLIKAFLAAMAWISFKTIILFYVFSHELFAIQDIVYSWSRYSRLAEITNIDPTIVLSRVFMQSQIWIVFGLFILLALGFSYISRNNLNDFVKKNYFSKEFLSIVVLSAVFLSTIIISFSRSFWIGSVLPFLFLILIFVFLNKNSLKTVLKCIALSFVIFLFSVLSVIGISRFPFPPGSASSDLIRSRATKFSGEAAVSSRYAQIRPLLESIKNHPAIGSGFGTQVSYFSMDPRVLKDSPDGLYTTYSFEIGWLEIWLKIGLVGVFAYLYLLVKIIKCGWKKFKDSMRAPFEKDISLVVGVLSGTLALFLIHGVSPYLNHPLGIGIVILCSVLCVREIKFLDSDFI